jgi:lysophospholipase L1-like esterase
VSKDAELVYLALGDSFTIGTGASHESRNFPSQLALRLGSATGHPVRVVNPAVTGFTTIDLLAKEIGFIDVLNPAFVSVLIGVNDLVRGRRVEQYRESVAEIYDAVATVGLAAGRVAAISLPDWFAAPAATDFGDREYLRRSTEAFNAAASAEAEGRGFASVDIGPVSRSGLGSPGWFSADEVHPGDPQYAAWSDEIWRQVDAAWGAPI